MVRRFIGKQPFILAHSEQFGGIINKGCRAAITAGKLPAHAQALNRNDSIEKRVLWVTGPFWRATNPAEPRDEGRTV